MCCQPATTIVCRNLGGRGVVMSEPIGDTMSREFAQDVTACILSGYNVQRGGERFVEIVTSKPSGHIDMVAVGGWGRREVLEISFHWRWPDKIGLKFVDTPRNGMTPDGLKHMSEYNAQLGVLLRKAKG